MAKDVKSGKKGYEVPWPPVRGDYQVCDPAAAVAVVTLTSPLVLRGAAIFGQCKTENLGVEKIVANVISNCNIRFLILCGVESKGHLPGNTILALHKNGIDEQGRIIGSNGAIPFIQNLPPEAISRFQDQVKLIDCIGIEDVTQIEELIVRYSRMAKPYPAEPFQVIKRKVAPRLIAAGEGDLFFGAGVAMDTTAWIVIDEREKEAAIEAAAEG
ncbi:MAG: tetrahydromethanopterin S-methyltransferase subunit A [Methanothrix sp.]|nr:tetrahydromethanopterin S-methyltransferase subunit A [Methanothrix sp.]